MAIPRGLLAAFYFLLIPSIPHAAVNSPAAEPNFAPASISGADGYGIADDGIDSLFLLGTYWGSISFDWYHTIHPLGSGTDGFLASYSRSGMVQWAVPFGSPVSDEARSVTIDPQGQLYFTGAYRSKIDFYSAAGTGAMKASGKSLIAIGDSDVYAARYNASGKVRWTASGGGPGKDRGLATALDGAGNLFVTGDFERRATFGQHSLISGGGSDVFIVKYDPSGTAIAAIGAGGWGDETGLAVATDADGNVYVVGTLGLGSIAKFGMESGTTQSMAGSATIGSFLAKYDPSLRFQWALPVGGTSNGVAVAADGSIYIAGSFSRTAAFGNLSAASIDGSLDAYLVKFDSNGEALWVRSQGGAGSDSAQSVVVGTDGTITVGGIFSGSAEFGSIELASQGGADAFIAKWRDNGSLVWAISQGTSDEDALRAVAVAAPAPSMRSALYSVSAGSIGNQSDAAGNPTRQAWATIIDQSGDFVTSMHTDMPP